ncbi:hypothetical protein [Kitasatospora purpeofusca]|uniref:hypothetical protein n=1 Tax=Kitasatospora purpeofusca TaxID=67352 RepID=UPI003824B70A
MGGGGHLGGGGYGPLSRRHGSVVGHLHAVEDPWPLRAEVAVFVEIHLERRENALGRD